MRRRVLQLQNAVLRHLAVAGLVAGLALIGRYGQRLCPERRRPRPGPGQAQRPPMRPAQRCRQGQPAQDRRIRRGRAGHQRPGRQSRMRLARPPRRAPDVARRPRHRVSPPRPLRPLRLPRRPRPGDVPLPDPVWRPDRPQGGARPSTAAFTPAGSIRARSRRPLRRDTTRRRRPPPATRRPPPRRRQRPAAPPASAPAPAPNSSGVR